VTIKFHRYLIFVTFLFYPFAHLMKKGGLTPLLSQLTLTIMSKCHLLETTHHVFKRSFHLCS